MVGGRIALKKREEKKRWLAQGLAWVSFARAIKEGRGVRDRTERGHDGRRA